MKKHTHKHRTAPSGSRRRLESSSFRREQNSPEMAFVTAINGECSAGATPHTTWYPARPASANVARRGTPPSPESLAYPKARRAHAATLARCAERRESSRVRIQSARTRSGCRAPVHYYTSTHTPRVTRASDHAHTAPSNSSLEYCTLKLQNSLT